MNIKSYIIGDNNNDLFGCHNDAKLIYNLFYTFYLKNKNIWILPKIYLNTIFENIDINYENSKIIIFFSGHTNKKGNLIINYNNYSSDYILKLINSKEKKCEVIFIIDSCYSINFISKNKYKFIFKISYFLSKSINNESKEFLIEYKNNNYKYTSINNNYSKIVNGIFTYYFYKILNNKIYNNINLWNNLINDPIWKYIFTKFKQEIYYYSL
jgi:hypothetical protein